MITRRIGTSFFLLVLTMSTAEAAPRPQGGGDVDSARRETGTELTSVVDRGALAAARIGDLVTIALPDRVDTGRVTWRRENSAERVVIAGDLDESAGSFTIALNGDAVYGHVRRADGSVVVLRTIAGGPMVVERVESKEPFCEVAHVGLSPGSAPDASLASSCDDGTVIDVLAAYTEDAALDAGGVAEIEAAIDLAIEENNIAWANSGVDRQQNLVLTWQVRPAQFWRGIELGCLIDPADGCLDELHALRDLYGADLVVLVDNTGPAVTRGLATLDPAHESQAFALTPLSNFSNVVVSHELGHQMGCCHARGDGGGCGEGLLYPYSNGYRFTGVSGTEWRTVMAYAPGAVSLYFSNPDVEHDGQPTGVPQSEPDSADNVATIESSALMVSNYRCAGVCDGSNQPSDGPDCNRNGIPDACDLARGASHDFDGDAVPDECEDACSGTPVLVVSSDPADNPDFSTIGQAVNAAVQSGTRIEILPGATGRYTESVVVDRALSLSFCGVGTDGPSPVVDGGSGPAFEVVAGSDDFPVLFENLTLRGAAGIRSGRTTALDRISFEGAPTMSPALDLGGGACLATGLHMDETVVDGIDLAAGARLDLERSSLIGLAGAAGQLAGEARLTNVLIGGADTGLTLADTADVRLAHTTVASTRSGPAIDNPAHGKLSVYLSILSGSLGYDAPDLNCNSEVARSIVDSHPILCSFYWSSSADPRLDENYVPQSGSSALERGPAPETYTGIPCTDLTGGPRLRDYDGDGLAHADAGAFEAVNTAVAPAPVANVRWISSGDLVWDPTPGAVAYHLYRADSATLGYADFGSCIDGLDPDRTDETFSEGAVPQAGQAYFYQVAAEDAGAAQSSLGFAACAERSRLDDCL